MGSTKTFSDEGQNEVYQKEFNNEIYSSGLQNSYNLGSTHFSDQSGIGNFSQSGNDPRKANLSGALFAGNIGFTLQTTLLDVGTNTIDLNNDSSGNTLFTISTDRFVTLSTGTIADLITITGVQRPGQRLVLYNTLTNTITIKHTAAATVNTIRTPDAGDFVFLPDMAVTLLYDITTTQWRIEGGSGTGGGISPPFVDTNPLIKGSVDDTKLLRFEVDGFTPGVTRVLTPPDADALLAGLNLTQSWTGTNTFTGTTFNVQTSAINFGDAITDEISFLGRVGDLGILPINNSAANLGASGNQWNTLWIDILQNASTVVVSSPNFAINSAQITLGDAITDEISFLGRVGDLGILPINNSAANLGASGNQWNTLWIDILQNASTVVVSSPNFAINSAQITLGDAITDEISFLGRIGSNAIIPITDSTTDLGTSALAFQTLFVDIINNLSAVTFTSPITNLNSAQTRLGDASSDNLQFLGQVSTNIVMEEISTPGNSPANTGRFYAKVDGGVSVPFWKDEAGTETSMIAGGTGSQTPWVSNIDADGFDLQDLSNIEFRDTTGAPPTNVGRIWQDSSGLNIGSAAATEEIGFFLGSTEQIRFDEDGEILFVDDNHKIVPQITSLNFTSNNATDEFRFQCGGTSSNPNFVIEEHRLTLRTEDADTSAADLQLIQNHSTPLDDRTIGNVIFWAENTSSVETQYAVIQVSSSDVTAGTEDGEMLIGVASDGGLPTAIGIQGGTSDANGAKIGFFGETPVVQQQLDASPTNAEISTALRNLGLTKL